jgi:DNA topoisomerase-1
LGTPAGADEPIQLFDGPYGLYVKQGKLNASLPEGGSAETITLEQAVELLGAKAASGKGSRAAGTGRGRTAGAAKAAGASPAKASGGGKASAGKSGSGGSRAAAGRKPPATTKTGRLRASPVRVIRAADS